MPHDVVPLLEEDGTRGFPQRSFSNRPRCEATIGTRRRKRGERRNADTGSPHGKPTAFTLPYHHTLQTACRAAGIEDFRFHDLRHTFDTNMRKAGVDRSVIMKITGHKTMSMFERYNTVDGDDAIEACKRLDAFLTPSEPVQEVTAILLQSPLQQ